METIEKLRHASNGIQRFIDNKDQIVLDLVKAHEDEIIDFVTEDQLLDKGIDGTGKPIRPEYRPYTVFLKGLKGQTTDHVTLKNFGDYHKSHYLTFGADEFDIETSDPKTAKLKAKYGDDISTLTPDNKQKTGELIRPGLEKTLRGYIIP